MAKTSIFSRIFLVVLVGLLSLDMAIGVNFDYKQALDKSLMFFEAQRSGKLPANQRVKWRGDSGLKDGLTQGVNLVGGYYDAGDHVKFGLPMAFTVTMLSWGVVEFRRQITSLNQMGQSLWAIKWGTDYFLKAHTQPNVLWAQVGDGDSDHYCWERAEDMTTPRTAYKLDQAHPGSDLAGETAAALAAASIAFRPYNSSYSALLLKHAKELFTFADKIRGLYHDSIPNAKKFYSSSGYSDELLWAATWLYEATNDVSYLKYVVDNGVSMGATGREAKEFSWDDKYAGVQVLLSKILLAGRGGPYASKLEQYQAKANYFACACVQKNGGDNVQLTPGGLMHLHEWNNLQYVSAASFLLVVYSDSLSAAKAKLTCPAGQIEPLILLNFAKSQIDYILGKNPKSISYLVGYGPKYPLHVHHRGASIPSISILTSVVGCAQGYDEWYHRPQPNPNVIFGALVGGPDENDGFLDDRSSYEQSEPTLTACAPLPGLFSRLSSFSGKNYEASPVTHPGKPKTPIQFLHSITGSWFSGSTMQYRHKVIIKNTSQKPITTLKLMTENLSGTLYGLTPAQEKNTYELPAWLKVLNPGSEFSFVYVQGGPQAKISVLSCQ